MKAYPAPPFTVEMAFLPNVWGYSGGTAVAAFASGTPSSGKLVAFGLGGSTSSMEVRGYNYTSPTSVSG